MALLFLDTCHGYDTSNPRTQTATVYAACSSGTPTAGINSAGRFPGTVGLSSNDGGTIFTLGFFIKPTTSLVRAAIDYKRAVTGSLDSPVFALTGSSAVNGFFVYSNFQARTDAFTYVVQSPAGKFLLYRQGVLLATSTNAFPSQTEYYRLETATDTKAAGSFKLWVNNVLEIDFSGDTLGTSSGPIGAILFSGNNSNTTTYSTWAVWDDVGTTGFSGFLGDFQPVRLLPNAAGSVTQGTVTGAASNYLAVDDPFRNGNTDYVTLATNGAKDLYAYTDLTATGPILSVVAQPSSSLGGTGTARIRAEAKSGDATAQSAPSQPLRTLGGIYGTVDTFEFPVDPATGAAWTTAAVNAAEFGVSAVL